MKKVWMKNRERSERIRRTAYERKYRCYQEAWERNGEERMEFPAKDAQIVLDVILDSSEASGRKHSGVIEELGLDRLLIWNLKYGRNKIPAFREIAISGISGRCRLLRKYWNSSDPARSYFSLFYTIYPGYPDECYFELMEAVYHAGFSDERKREMIRFMNQDGMEKTEKY